MNNITIPRSDFVMFLRFARQAIKLTKTRIADNPEVISDFYSEEKYNEELDRLNDVARSLEIVSRMSILNLQVHDNKELDIVHKSLINVNSDFN